MYRSMTLKDATGNLRTGDRGDPSARKVAIVLCL